jgi:hypothetical protein
MEMGYVTFSFEIVSINVKIQVFPVQVWRVPEVSRRMILPHFITIGT